MKLISLNTWGGREFRPLINFIKKTSLDTDIFCFQEIFSSDSNSFELGNFRINLLEELKKILVDYQYFFTLRSNSCLPDLGEVKKDIKFGQAIFVKKNINVGDSGELLIYKDSPGNPLVADGDNMPVLLQYLVLDLFEKELFLGNFHGRTRPGNKLDTPLRLEQSKKIVDFISAREEEKIICGDFNLEPDTTSIKLIENSGMRNLIKDFDIKDTRGEINHKLYEGISTQTHADYTFVSPSVKVMNFKAPQLKISDHLPLVLEFSL